MKVTYSWPHPAGYRIIPEPIDSATLWELHLRVAANDRLKGKEAGERSMRSARAHAAARKLGPKHA